MGTGMAVVLGTGTGTETRTVVEMGTGTEMVVGMGTGTKGVAMGTGTKDAVMGTGTTMGAVTGTAVVARAETNAARVASFDEIRPEKDGTTETRSADPVRRSGFDNVEKPRVTPEPGREASNDGPAVFRSPGKAPGYVTPPKTAEGKSRSSGPVVNRGGTRTSTPTVVTPPKAEGGKARGNGTTVNRSSRPETPRFSGEARTTGGKANSSGYRGGSRSAAPVLTSQPRPATGKGRQVYNQPTRVSTGVLAKASSSGSKSSGGAASTPQKSSGGGARASRKSRN